MTDRKTIALLIDGTFPNKGKIHCEKKITYNTMARILMVVAEFEEREAQEKKYRREIKKQNKIVEQLEEERTR